MFGGKSSFEPLISPSFLWMSAQIVPEFGHAPLKRRRRPSKAIVEKATLSKCISRFGFSDEPERYIDWAPKLLHPFGYKFETYRNNFCCGSHRCSWPASMIVQLGTFRSVQRMLRAELWQQQQTN